MVSQPGKNETQGTENRNKWNSFNIIGRSRAPVTFRHVLKLTKDAETEAAELTIKDLRQRVASADTMVELTDTIKAFKKVNFAAIPLVQESVVDEIRKRIKRIAESRTNCREEGELRRGRDSRK